MPKIRSIAMVDPTEASRKELRNLLLGIEWIHLDTECARYDVFAEVVDQSHPRPDVAVICIDGDADQSLALIKKLQQRFPELPVMAISGRPDLLIKAHDHGVKSLLMPPLKLEDMCQKLIKLLDPDVKKGQLIALLGSRGGVGCTSLAVNLGCCLAQDSRHQTALIDFDLTCGDVDVALEVKPEYRLADLSRCIDQIDLQFLRKALCKHAPTGLSLLLRPLEIRDMDLIHEDHIDRLLGLLSISFTHVLADLNKGWTAIDRLVLRQADIILLVTQLEVASLRNAVFMLTALAQEDQGAKVRIILNRVGAAFAGDDIPLKRAEDILGGSMYWQVPNDSRAMLGAWKKGVPLLLHAPKSPVLLSIADLALDLSGTAGSVNTRRTGKPSSLSAVFRAFRGK